MQKISFARYFRTPGDFFRVFYSYKTHNNPFTDYEVVQIGNEKQIVGGRKITLSINNNGKSRDKKRFSYIPNDAKGFSNIIKTPYALGEFQFKKLYAGRHIQGFGIHYSSGWKNTGRITYFNKNESSKILVLDARFHGDRGEQSVAGLVSLISNEAIPREDVFGAEEDYLVGKEFFVEAESSDLKRTDPGIYFYSGFKKPDARLK